MKNKLKNRLKTIEIGEPLETEREAHRISKTQMTCNNEKD
jgi:hypothetical protein